MFADMFYIFYKFVRRWKDNPVETGNNIPEVDNNEIDFAIEDKPVY